MRFHKTASGADRLLNLQLGTGEKEDEDGERERERVRERNGGWGVNNTHITGSTDLFLCLSVSPPRGSEGPAYRLQRRGRGNHRSGRPCVRLYLLCRAAHAQRVFE